MDQTNLRRSSNEIKIDIKDFIWRLLEQWKGIVVFVIIFMLLVSGVTYFRASSAIEDEDVVIDSNAVENMLDSLSSSDRGLVMSAFREKMDLNNLREYIADSTYMSLDPYRVKTLIVSILIDSDEEINKQLVSAYYNELDSSLVAQKINAAWGDKYTVEQISELIFVKVSGSSEDDNYSEGNVLNLCVYIPEDVSPEQALEAVEEAVPEIVGTLNNSIGEHKTSVISFDVKTISDKDYAMDQYDIFSRVHSMSESVTAMVDKMTPEQKAVYEALEEFEESSEDSNKAEDDAESITAKPKFFTAKGLAVGFVFGCLIYGGAYLLYYVFSGKIFSSANLVDYFGVRLLSEWYPNKKSGLPVSLFRDSKVYKTHYKGHLDMEKEVNRAADSVINTLSGRENGKILLVSNSAPDENIVSFISALKDSLKNNSIDVLSSCVDMKNGISLSEQTVKDVDGCVLIADEQSLGFNDVRDVFDKCYYCDRPFIGTVFVR